MILRDVIVSEQRRQVGVAIALPPMTPAADSFMASVDGRAAARSSIEVAAPLEAPAAPARESSPLSFEAVAAWLAVQDPATRTACASILATELIQVREASRIEGFAAGASEGRIAAEHELTQRHALLQSMAGAAEAALEQERARVGELCVDIVAEAFTKIAGPLLSTRAAIQGAIIEVLRRVKEGRELTVRVCHADLAVLQQDEARLAAALPGRKFSLVADPRVDVGGCLVESRFGNLDGRLEVQLRELYETLRAAKSAQPELQ